jgi:hypothetical protein
MRRSASLQIRFSRSGWRAHGATTYCEHPPGVQLFAGRLALASSLVEQVPAVADVTDNRTVPNAALAVAALRGRENDARQLITSATKGPCCQRRRNGAKPRAPGHCGFA